MEISLGIIVHNNLDDRSSGSSRSLGREVLTSTEQPADITQKFVLKTPGGHQYHLGGTVYGRSKPFRELYSFKHLAGNLALTSLNQILTFFNFGQKGRIVLEGTK